MDWAESYKKIQPYIMSIETPSGSGTGFLFTYNAEKTFAGFATAAHVVEHAHNWKQPIKLIHFMTGNEYFSTDGLRIVLLDRDYDSASILIGNKDLGIPSDALPMMDSSNLLSIGLEVGWVGFPSISPSNLCLFTGRISAHIKHHNSYLIDGVAINGVSGGPVFYCSKDGELMIIGTVSSYMPNRIYGDTLPGLLRVQDVTAFQATINKIKSIDDAKKAQDEHDKKELDKPSNAVKKS